MAFALAVALATPAAPVSAEEVGGTFVYLVDHGWHVGLAVGGDDLAAAGRPADESLGAFRYLEVGWGDGDYYPAPRGTASLALRAAFRSRASVIQVVGFDGGVAETFPCSKILEVGLTLQGFAALARYIYGTFVLDDEGRRIVVAPALYGTGFFYLARGRYRLANNSNNWTARGLAIAGCPIDAEAAGTAGTLLHQAARFARVLRPGVVPRASEEPAARCG